MGDVHHYHHGSTGIGIGTILAVVLSWMANHSVGWAIIHGIFGWFYVIYNLLGGGK